MPTLGGISPWETELQLQGCVIVLVWRSMYWLLGPQYAVVFRGGVFLRWLVTLTSSADWLLIESQLNCLLGISGSLANWGLPQRSITFRGSLNLSISLPLFLLPGHHEVWVASSSICQDFPRIDPKVTEPTIDSNLKNHHPKTSPPAFKLSSFRCFITVTES